MAQTLVIILAPIIIMNINIIPVCISHNNKRINEIIVTLYDVYGWEDLEVLREDLRDDDAMIQTCFESMRFVWQWINHNRVEMIAEICWRLLVFL